MSKSSATKRDILGSKAQNLNELINIRIKHYFSLKNSFKLAKLDKESENCVFETNFTPRIFLNDTPKKLLAYFHFKNWSLNIGLYLSDHSYGSIVSTEFLPFLTQRSQELSIFLDDSEECIISRFLFGFREVFKHMRYIYFFTLKINELFILTLKNMKFLHTFRIREYTVAGDTELEGLKLFFNQISSFECESQPVGKHIDTLTDLLLATKKRYKTITLKYFPFCNSDVFPENDFSVHSMKVTFKNFRCVGNTLISDYTSLMKHLAVIKLYGFIGRLAEFYMHVIKRATCLKELTIDYCPSYPLYDFSPWFQHLRKLQKFEYMSEDEISSCMIIYELARWCKSLKSICYHNFEDDSLNLAPMIGAFKYLSSLTLDVSSSVSSEIIAKLIISSIYLKDVEIGLQAFCGSVIENILVQNQFLTRLHILVSEGGNFRFMDVCQNKSYHNKL